MDEASDIIIPANLLLFSKLTNLFERLHKKRKQRHEQNKLLENFIMEFRIDVAKTTSKKDTTFFPILRLLLPNCERERNPYNLKETKLGGLLVKVLSLNKSSGVAKKLLNFRSVHNASNESDFAGVAYYELKNRVGQNSSNLTIGNINEILDTIANAEIGNKGSILDEAFSYAMKKLTPEEFKWFLRIILKDLKLGMSTTRILAALHPDAPDFYQNCNSIRKVCEEFVDGNTRPLELGIKMFSAICPMLSERLDVTDIQQLSSDKTYQLEDKFDGERFQMHMENGVFEYFSRKGYPYSNNYGKNYDSGLLTPYLKDCFTKDAKNFILDGEMMGWHKEKQCFGCKGMSYDIKKVTENSSFRPCYCVFDILYYNGKPLTGPPEKGGVPLRERLNILDTLFTDRTGFIQHSERRKIKKSSELLEALNKAIDNQDEGIVVKDVDSYYLVNKRNAGWYKIKPEYTEGATTDLDLVIVGADEAENKRQGRAKSFHVACVDVTADASPKRWVCVGRVASGLSFDERERLCSLLEQNWKSFKKIPAPSSLYFNKEKPDLWILPEHSVVLQVRATEIIRSSSFGADYTLRFPRIIKIREDKPIKDILTLDQFYNFAPKGKSVEKLSTKRINEEQIDYGGEIKARKTRAAKVVQVAEQFRVRSTGDVQVTSKALLGRKLCVYSDDEDCKKVDLIKIIESHGGKHSENMGSDTWCTVVSMRTNRDRKLVAMQQHDIVPTSWLRTLPASDTPYTLTPLVMLSMKQETRLNFSWEYDAFGDSYKEETDATTLKKCFDKMEEPQIPLTLKEKMELDSQLFDDGNPFSFLRSCVIQVKSPLRKLLAKLYGARVSGEDTTLTHLVVPRNTKLEDIDVRASHVKIVAEEWLDTCIEKKALVPEDKFLLS